ncbi:MAG: YceI family protein [Betaproteobacteria bacterium]
MPQPSRVRPLGAVAEKTVRYEILPDLSDIRFLVYRAGPLAKLGHNHVVQAKNIKGEIHVAPDIQQSSFSIEVPVKDFKVDDDTARSEEGDEFFPQPDGDAIAGTARNMLGEKVLEAEKYPTIEIRSAGLSGPSWGMDILVRIRMHGIEREVVVPTVIEKSSDKLVATAFFSINQTDYGITPMSVLGGGLKVQDAIKVRMRIVAQMR